MLDHTFKAEGSCHSPFAFLPNWVALIALPSAHMHFEFIVKLNLTLVQVLQRLLSKDGQVDLMGSLCH